jgi:hypothetical protein
LGAKYEIDNWVKAAVLFRQSGEKIKTLCQAALAQDKQQILKNLLEIAALEEKAYCLLKGA